MSTPHLFLLQEDEKDVPFNSSTLIIEEAFQRSDGSHPEIAPAAAAAAAEDPLEFQFQFHQEEEEEDDDDEDEISNLVCEKQDLEWCTTTPPHPAASAAEGTSSVSSWTKTQNPSLCLGLGLGMYEVADDDDGGFATPVSSHHKIPVTAQCPPAPKKIRTPHSSSTKSKKRKSPPRTRRHLHLDLSTEVESMFPPTVRDDLGRKIKKAKLED